MCLLSQLNHLKNIYPYSEYPLCFVLDVPNRVPANSFVAYRCPIGWALSDNPNIEPYVRRTCQADNGTFDGADEEWPRCFNPDAPKGKAT